jgi:hypothetical protein
MDARRLGDGQEIRLDPHGLAREAGRAVLAETVSIDGRLLALALFLLLLVAVVSICSIVGGFVLAPRAARGSSMAMAWWVACLSVEGLSALGSVASILTLSLNPFALVMPAVIAWQVVIFRRARDANP